MSSSGSGPPARAESENAGARGDSHVEGGLNGPESLQLRQEPVARPEEARREGCVFCAIVDGAVSADVVAERPLAIAFRDLHPVAPTHVLVVPRGHIPDAAAVGEAHGDVLADMLLLAQEVAEGDDVAGSGFRLVMNVGEDSGNTVGHLHLHVLGGRALGALG